MTDNIYNRYLDLISRQKCIYPAHSMVDFPDYSPDYAEPGASAERVGTGLPKTYTKGKKQGSDLSSFVFGKLPPQARELEEAVLGALLIDKDAVTTIIDILQPRSFYVDSHQHIYQAILDLFEKSHPIDMLTVTEELRKSAELETVGGAYFIAELSNKVTSAANVEHHARIIAQKFIQRELIRISTKIVTDAYEDTTDVLELLDRSEQSLFEIAEQNLRRSYDSMSLLVKEAIEEIDKARHHEDSLTGIQSGFTELDRVTSGWQRSDLIILAARPGMGKTAFILAVARNASVDFSRPVAMFSLEMSSVQLVKRLISMETELSGDKLRKGNLAEHEWIQLTKMTGRLADAPMFIDDTPGINIFELRAKCRRLK
ncbi:MAG: replicative DNA helicase, partial [Limisphaerales bacterium]